jgi:Nif-specific regulatory protein
VDARLVAIAGPLKGSTFALAGEEVAIGRDLACRIAIGDGSVSRRHSRVLPDADGRWVVSDLGSRNGTFVNGVPVTDRALRHGDQIGIGTSLFVFLSEAAGRERPDVWTEVEVTLGSTVRLRREDALYLDAARLAEALRATAEAAGLDLMLEAVRTLHRARSVEKACRALLGLVARALPAQRAAVLLAGEDGGELERLFGEDRSGRPVRVSRSVVEEVRREGSAILSNDVRASSASSESLMEAGVQALAAAPLGTGERLIGVVYADTTDPGTRFEERHLHLLVGLADVAALAVENLHHLDWLEAETRRLRGEAAVEHGMVGESPAMRRVYELIRKVAPTDATVLLLGGSGTGKELAARAIHVGSPRSSGPFVAINCAALTETLLESELFGHERGAFTGAVALKKGRLELADRGTVFLDEVGEMSPALQAKLLRFLQEKEFERVGGTRPLRVDARVIAATNRDLAEAARSEVFRRDLYYRLGGFAIEMPALRDRGEDIRLLASFFVSRSARRLKKSIVGITPAAWNCLLRYEWPGNVRELENAMERAVILAEGSLIAPEDLPEALTEAEPPAGEPGTGYHEALNRTKRQLILEALEQSQGSFTEAARRLGLHPNYLHRLVRNLGLRSELKKPS